MADSGAIDNAAAKSSETNSIFGYQIVIEEEKAILINETELLNVDEPEVEEVIELVADAGDKERNSEIPPP